MNNHVDKLLYLNEDYISEILKLEEIRHTLLIGEENGAQSYVIWNIDKIMENKSKLTITVYPYSF